MKTKRFFLSAGFFLLCVGAAFLSYVFHAFNNYPVHDVYVRHSQEHPQFIPTRTFIDIVGAGYRSVFANMTYLRAIQYIASFFVTAEYKTYAYRIFHSILELDPYFENVYRFAPTILALSSPGEPFTKDQQKVFTDQAISLSYEGIQNLCDAQKIKKILAPEVSAVGLPDNPELASPCGANYMIAYYLAYILFENKKDNAEVAKWYKIAAAHPNAPRVSEYMYYTVLGRSNGHANSALGMLSLAESFAKTDKKPECETISSELSSALFTEIKKTGTISAAFLKTTAPLKPLLSVEEDRCSVNTIRALRELDLAYLDSADEKFFQKFHRHASSEELLAGGWISFIPQSVWAQETTHYFYDPNIASWTWGNQKKKK